MIMQSEQKNSISRIAFIDIGISNTFSEFGKCLSIKNPLNDNTDIKGCVVTFNNKRFYRGSNRVRINICIYDKHYLFTKKCQDRASYYKSLRGKSEDKDYRGLNEKCEICRIDKNIEMAGRVRRRR